MTTHIFPRCITGYHPINSPRHCADWGSQRMLAFGNGSNIVILLTEPLQQLTTLVGHHANVHRVKWQHESFNHSLNVPYRCWLASCDVDGNIIVWDVASAVQVASFNDGSNRPVLTIDWLNSLQSATRDLLVAIHPNFSLVMWNAATGNKLWRKTYTCELFSFSLDPFDASRILMLSTDCILFVTDFMISQAPSSDGKKLNLPASSRHTKSPSNLSLSSDPINNTSSNVMLSTTRSFGKQISNVIGATGMRPSGDFSFNDNSNYNSSEDSIIQVEFLPTVRDHYMVVQHYKISIINIQVDVTVCNILLDNTLSPFVQVYPCKQRDAFYCLHNNGNVTFRILRPFYAKESTKTFTLNYDVRAQSESIRVSKQHRVMALAVCPNSERTVSVVCSDARVFLWTVNRIVLPDKEEKGSSETAFASNHEDVSPSSAVIVPSPQVPRLRGVVLSEQPPQISYLRDLFLPSRLFLDENLVLENSESVQLKFIMCGLVTFLGLPPFVVKMCPPLTTKNLLFYRPILAVGSANGIVYLIDLNHGTIIKEFSVHTGFVSGIEWCYLDSFISFSVIFSGTSSNHVKNELMFVDISTGKCQSLIAQKTNSSSVSPISFVRVSPLKNYFVVVYKSKPFEIWDLKTKRMLREVKIVSTAPITALEWSPTSRVSKSKKSADHKNNEVVEAGNSPSASQSHNESGSASVAKSKSSVSSTREGFVFTNSGGLLCHLTVEAGALQDASRYPPEGGMTNVTAMTWKADILAFGDNEGGVSLWDLKLKICRGINVPRIGPVRKLKFAPGKGNTFLLILLVEGVDIWDAKDVQHISSLRNKSSMGRVVDADWAASSEPVLAFSDGTVRVCDLELNCYAKAFKHTDLFVPCLLNSKSGLSLKYSILLAKDVIQWNEDGSAVKDVKLENDICEDVVSKLNLIASDTLNKICKSSTLDRCLNAARLFSDAWDSQFWTVAEFYLTRFKEIDSILLNLGGDDEDEGNDGTEEERKNSGSSLSATKDFLLTFLDCDSSDYVLPNDVYRKMVLEREYTLSSASNDLPPSANAILKNHCARNLIKFGDAEEASVLLLSTDPCESSFHVNSLKTCLVNLIAVSGGAEKLNENISKLVATNMIASGFLDDGVEVLCMYNKYLDACRYLQSYGNWNESLSLAKISLRDSESYQDIVKKWTEFLVSPQINQKNLAVLIFISTNQFYKALQLLLATQQAAKAYLFLKVMKELKLIGSTSGGGEELDLYNDIEVESVEQLTTALSGLGFHSLSL